MMSDPETMTAAYVTRPGPADEIRIGRFHVPGPGSSEVLVKVRALAVNHVGTFVRSGAYRTRLPYPFVIGRDLVGTVPLLARGGRMIIMAGLGAAPVLPVGQLYTRDASLRGFAISNATVAELAAAATAINHLLARGTLISRIGTRLPLAEAARAHRLQEGAEPGHPRGRIVVLP
ncbi:zinc-binding dehydrogenase [Streptosporangium sp. NPDC023825]|uniref:alcohol dehydrogenase catalytic domain-containing protein n=1 Tax=Streptosporangium sp. NPDC023825 TaxID=3154909 RepID=UPI00341D17B9